jgi:hypothetical protein
LTWFEKIKLDDIYRQSRAYKTVLAIGEIGLLWIVITANSFVFNRYTGNEHDILPFARQYVDRSWLPGDWYLNLGIAYRQLFNYIFGNLVVWFGFLNGAYIGRLIAYLLLALALFVFLRTIRLRFSLGLIVVLVFLGNQSLIAGEWIAGGVDTKTFAYAFALLSLSTFLQRKYLAGFAFAGAALSFHVLIGIYALICTATALLFTYNAWHKDLKALLRGSWALFATGIFGIQAILQQLLPKGDIDASKAWDIYVEFRVPHHVLPSAWQGEQWILGLILATGIFLSVYLLTKNNIERFTAGYALGSVGLFGIGLAVYALGYTPLLRFYWFRYGDVLVPFLGLILAALILDRLTKIELSTYPRVPENLHWIQPILQKGLPLLFAIIAVLLTLQSAQFLRAKYYRGMSRPQAETATVFNWIRENTPREAVFLIDPLISDFYINTDRGRFVSLNHSPQSAEDILEWYKRIQLSNKNQPPRMPASREELQSNFYQLDQGAIQQLGDAYGIDYYLGSAGQQLPFEIVYQDAYFSLFAIDEEEPPNASE